MLIKIYLLIISNLSSYWTKRDKNREDNVMISISLRLTCFLRNKSLNRHFYILINTVLFSRSLLESPKDPTNILISCYESPPFQRLHFKVHFFSISTSLFQSFLSYLHHDRCNIPANRGRRWRRWGIKWMSKSPRYRSRMDGGTRNNCRWKIFMTITTR